MIGITIFILCSLIDLSLILLINYYSNQDKHEIALSYAKVGEYTTYLMLLGLLLFFINI